MALFKKRKKESVAIPFLISMVITLLLVGIPVFNYYNKMVTDKSGAIGNAAGSEFIPTEANDTTILFTFTPNDKNLRPSFVILRTSAMNRNFTFIPVSNDMLCGSEKMADIFRKGGVIELKKAVEKTFETSIDRYMNLNDEALTVICDALGGVNYVVPDGLRGINAGSQFLNSEFIITLISNVKYAEDARTVTTGNVFADMLAATSGTRAADIMDYTYNKVINVAETDITAIDFDNQKPALDYILRSDYTSTYRVPSGKTTEQGVTLDGEALKQLKVDSGLK